MNHFQLPLGIGTLDITWNNAGKLTRLNWLETCTPYRTNFRHFDIPLEIQALLEKIENYFFQGAPLTSVSQELLDQSLWTTFQKSVYEVIATIPHGETRTYAWVASKLKVNGRGCRAVGQALRKNPFPILIPCHRIVGASALGGFMGISEPDQPELLLKQRLLDLESSYLNPVFPFLTNGWLNEPLVRNRSA
jgi:methylated-DNA-[protein]-cysteine S-methyltransferase